MALPITLDVVAQIDGVDQLHLSPTGARWAHRQYRWPTRVILNDVKWRPAESAYIANEGRTRFLPSDVDFSRIFVVKRAGRSPVSVMSREEGAVIYFNDVQPGSAQYTVLLRFGRKPEH